MSESRSERYRTSTEWAVIKEKTRNKYRYRCPVCGMTADGGFDTHHLTYDRENNENVDTDMMLLCHSCHMKVKPIWDEVERNRREYLKKRRAFLDGKEQRYISGETFDRIVGKCTFLNTFMKHDKTAGGDTFVNGINNLKMLGAEYGVNTEYGISEVDKMLSIMHVMFIRDELSDWGHETIEDMIRKGYPEKWVRNHRAKERTWEPTIKTIHDAVICYLHKGQGEWIETCDPDKKAYQAFEPRFMPYIRYENEPWRIGGEWDV